MFIITSRLEEIQRAKAAELATRATSVQTDPAKTLPTEGGEDARKVRTRRLIQLGPSRISTMCKRFVNSEMDWETC